jgi:hypothetical protein
MTNYRRKLNMLPSLAAQEAEEKHRKVLEAVRKLRKINYTFLCLTSTLRTNRGNTLILANHTLPCLLTLLLHSFHTATKLSYDMLISLRRLYRKCVLWRYPPTGEHMEVVYHVLPIEIMPGNRQETRRFLVFLPRQTSALKP